MFIVLYNDANRNHDQNHSQSTLCKYTFGWELVIRDPMEYAYLDKRWMLHCTVKSFINIYDGSLCGCRPVPIMFNVYRKINPFYWNKISTFNLTQVYTSINSNQTLFQGMPRDFWRSGYKFLLGKPIFTRWANLNVSEPQHSTTNPSVSNSDLNATDQNSPIEIVSNKLKAVVNNVKPAINTLYNTAVTIKTIGNLVSNRSMPQGCTPVYRLA